MKKYPFLMYCFLFFIWNGNAQNLPPGFQNTLVTDKISFPTVMAFAPDGRLFVAQQSGELKIIKAGALLPTPFMKVSVNSSGERGLLGIAFDPEFATNNFIYLYYTTATAPVHNRISRFTANGDVVAAGSEMILLDLNNLSSATNHNGGALRFGTDGKLYVGVGENATGSYAQNLDNYLGKILRINPNGSAPSDNPFTTGSESKKRIWAYGLRNPYTFDIQESTGKIFVNDVGQNTWEEINDATIPGKNFGWPNVEGKGNNSLYTNPIYYYSSISPGRDTTGCAITGGIFFDPANSNYPSAYLNKYYFNDYCGNWINILDQNNGFKRTNFATNLSEASLGLEEGPDGNIYYLNRTNNAVYKITYSALTAVADAAVEDIRVYPLPAESIVNIEISSAGNTLAQMSLSDALGNIVLRERALLNTGENKNELNLSPFSSGIYILKVQTGNQVLTKKLIKL